MTHTLGELMTRRELLKEPGISESSERRGRTRGGGPALNGTDLDLVCPTNIDVTHCATCHKNKPLSEMAPDRSTKTGYRSKCRDCRKNYTRGHYEAHKDAILAQQRVYRRAHPEIAWAADHRRRARSYDLQLATEIVTPEQLIAQWGNHCRYCGGPFEEIDHRIPVAARGHHTVLNVVPCCRRCNQKKRWLFDEPMIRKFREARSEKGGSGVAHQRAIPLRGQV
jgi:hypothetical protein